MSFINGSHILLRQADVRGSADIIYLGYIGRISLVCGSGIVIDVEK